MNHDDKPETPDDSGRRDLLVRLTAGAVIATSVLAASPASSAAARDSGAETAFRRAFATTTAGTADVDARLAFLADEASVIDHDVPYPMDRATYGDHLRFLAAHWDKLEFSIHDLRVADHGDAAAVVSCFYNERGKPRNAGFRQRAGFCTAMCARTASGWRAVALHMSPLTAQILDASPG
ncbi:nuclear transport factor 2 family protein [Rhizorhabdus wittichii]|uniref:Nuclear transport factor 2 family protein n=1 Tax=Rhizorhabdus wittichii TaxID=160791 RepID=A0A975D1U3_9SPHN|nr:nuclear transport factor 2 family protein [Rhizorhabdus wittichii]QTH20170.1 nuclear transport factor 2 family protein [Rhizorhabdus wittichii]